MGDHLLTRTWKPLRRGGAFSLLLLLILTFSTGTSIGAQAPSQVHLFYSSGCADCGPYVEETMKPALVARGWQAEQITVHDFTQAEGRQLLAQMLEDYQVPATLGSFLYAFVPWGEGLLLLEGHVPADLIEQAFALPDRPAKLLVAQQEMHSAPSEYTAWPFQGEPQTVSLDIPLSESIAQAGSGLPVYLSQTWREAQPTTLLPAVITGGLLDGINPCAFAVILLLVAFLFTIRQSRRRVLQLGGIYVAIIFLVYFTIGLGLLRAVTLFGDGHFVARAGAIILILLGLINLKDYFRPEWPIHLSMPSIAHREVNRLLKRATVPATAGMAFVVGLCTFPCSGGIYVSVLTLLAAKTTMAWGLGYLTLYNVLFIAPLIVILLAAGNRTTAKAWATWERTHVERIHLWYGLAMVALGIVLWVWVI